MIDISAEGILGRPAKYQHPNGAMVTVRIMAVRSPFVVVSDKGRSRELTPAELSWPDDKDVVADLRRSLPKAANG